MNAELKKILEENPGIHILPFGKDVADLPAGYKYLVHKRELSPADYYVNDVDGHDEFFLKKAFIFNLGSDCGVIFKNDAIKGDYLTEDKNVYQANAQVSILKPDGEEKTMTYGQTVDVDAEAELYADDLADRLAEGIVANDKTKKVIAKFKNGEWRTNGKEKRYFLDNAEMAVFIEREKKKFYLKTKANISSMAQTKAKMKAIKEIANISSSYPIELMTQPFVVIRPVKDIKLEAATEEQIEQTQAKVQAMF